jgi:hypothetical protein
LRQVGKLCYPKARKDGCPALREEIIHPSFLPLYFLSLLSFLPFIYLLFIWVFFIFYADAQRMC